MFIAVGYVYLLPISIIQTRMGVVLIVSIPASLKFGNLKPVKIGRMNVNSVVKARVIYFYRYLFDTKDLEGSSSPSSPIFCLTGAKTVNVRMTGLKTITTSCSSTLLLNK
jgi:hypothetical protein